MFYHPAASAHLAAAACPALTVNFFPEGTKNVPAGWTRDAQVAAGNEDTASLNTIKLTASPPPKLFVQPVHPLFSRKACVPADCLPAAKGRRLQGNAGDYGKVRIQPVASDGSPEDANPHVVTELQRADGAQWGLSNLNPFFWNLPYNPFGRKDKSSNKDASSDAGSLPLGYSSLDEDDSSSSSSKLGSRSAGQESRQRRRETPEAVDTDSSSDQAAKQITDVGGSGSMGIKDSIAAGGDGTTTPTTTKTGWTTWKEDDDWGPGGGEDRSLAACTTTVAQPASYDIWWNIDGGVAKKATMPKEGAPFIVLSNLDTLAAVSSFGTSGGNSSSSGTGPEGLTWRYCCYCC